LAEETVETDDPEKLERDLLGKYPWEKALREIIPWIQSNANYLGSYFALNESAEDYKGTKVVPIPLPEPSSEPEVFPSTFRLTVRLSPRTTRLQKMTTMISIPLKLHVF
jgi:hypothetical protein